MSTFELDHFDDFLAIANQQSEPQKLLLVLTRRELPQGHTDEQAEVFERGGGGHLAPLAGIDKQPSELSGFAAFEQEAAQLGEDWDAVFVAALPGSQGKLPTPKAVDDGIERVIHAIRSGMVNQFLVFDRQGVPLQLSHG
ncbi:hypothetical protein [Marinimicrobium sp. C2-29]|uniref:hypothetical protein n=1 Tax=Marinimicrobium sp. C2-29 TaxID=3139825 RepID=UPI00313906AF